VTIGVGYNGETVVPSGLKAGEIVVTDGQLRLAPKLKVSFKSAGQAENSK
jgi:multidrug efflux pump subunit AcrA (membrane-fusion protein)